MNKLVRNKNKEKRKKKKEKRMKWQVRYVSIAVVWVKELDQNLTFLVIDDLCLGAVLCKFVVEHRCSIFNVSWKTRVQSERCFELSWPDWTFAIRWINACSGCRNYCYVENCFQHVWWENNLDFKIYAPIIFGSETWEDLVLVIIKKLREKMRKRGKKK